MGTSNNFYNKERHISTQPSSQKAKPGSFLFAFSPAPVVRSGPPQECAYAQCQRRACAHGSLRLRRRRRSAYTVLPQVCLILSRSLASLSGRDRCSVGCWTGPRAPWVWLRSAPASRRSSSGRWVPGPQLPPGPLLLRAPPAPRPSPPTRQPQSCLSPVHGESSSGRWVPGPGPSPTRRPRGFPPGPWPTPPRAPGRMGDNTSPISVILVSSGSRGNKLLFRYPFQRSQEHPASQTSKWAPGAASLAVSGEAGYRVVSVLAVPSHHRVLGKCRKVKRSRKRITHSFNMSNHCC